MTNPCIKENSNADNADKPHILHNDSGIKPGEEFTIITVKRGYITVAAVADSSHTTTSTAEDID